jgi:lipase chaperone LimK
MAEYQEEIYLIEKREITDDEGDDSEFEKMQLEAAELDLPAMSVGDDADLHSSDDDLNDFNALKAKTQNKKAKTVT